jgi:hypothetical protein
MSIMSIISIMVASPSAGSFGRRRRLRRPGPAQPGGMTRNRTPKKLSDNPLVNAITTLPMPERQGTSGR